VSTLLGVPCLESLLDCGGWEESNALIRELILSLYTRLFAWLTGKLRTDQQRCKSAIDPYFKINVLDYTGSRGVVEGFEDFVVEAFATEVQEGLVDLKLREIQEVYARDGLEWITIDTKANCSGTTATTGLANLKRY
jgi:hypothetical protein